MTVLCGLVWGVRVAWCWGLGRGFEVSFWGFWILFRVVWVVFLFCWVGDLCCSLVCRWFGSVICDLGQWVRAAVVVLCLLFIYDDFCFGV